MTPYDPFSKKKSVTRTIRIDEAYDDVLRYEAERSGVSVNTIVDQILRKYSQSYRFLENSAVIVAIPTLVSFLETLDEAIIGELGKAAGSEHPKELLLKRGLPLTYEAAVWYIIELLGKNSGWYRATYHNREDKDIIHLSHTLGRKWSVFVNEYVVEFFKRVLEISPETEIGSSSVTLMITKSKIKRAS
ncbi:MAG: hypothetical protein NWE89_17190 [Candidatus Bathyarchaeota archaeon]|nr:hypothetical protein [Candidatus Bathyarchaeota archaeon]